MTRIRPKDAPEFLMRGHHVKGVAAPRHGAREVTMVRDVLEPGAAEPPHQHDHEEVVVVLQADAATATVGAEEYTLDAHDTLIIPPHTTHQLVNTGDTPVDMLAAQPAGTTYLTPAGEERTAPPWTT